jgi:hypothetical protein
MKMWHSKFGFIILFIASFVVLQAKDLSVRAYVDNTSPVLNQQFTLTVEISGEGVNQAGNPELPDMESFALFLGSGSSQNIQFINGRMSSSKVLSYHYQAVAGGKHQIGAITVKSGDNSYSTDPIDIEIIATAATQPAASSKQSVSKDSKEDLFIEAIIDKKTVYQDEPVTVTYKIYTRLQVSSFGFSKEPATTGFWKEDYDLPQQPVTSTEIVNGKQYTVATIKRQALFAMTPGAKKIEPLVITCEVRMRPQRSRDPFGDFFNDPFFGRTEQVNVSSNSVSFQVLPLPDEGKPADFSGAVGRFTLNTSVDKSRVKTNEAITYKIKIEGIGNIHTLPDPKADFSGDFEVFPPKVSETIKREAAPISGVRTYEYVLVPRFSGNPMIDPVKFSYFDPSVKKYQIVQSQPVSVQVDQGDQTFAYVTPDMIVRQERYHEKDIRYIREESPRFMKIGTTVFGTPLFWLAFITPLGALFGAMWARKHLDRLQGDMAYARDRRAGREAKRRLSRARKIIKSADSKVFFAEISKALLGFIGDKLNIPEAGIITDELKPLLQNHGIPKEVVGELFDILHTCDFQRFAPSEIIESEMENLVKRTERVLLQLNRGIRG